MKIIYYLCSKFLSYLTILLNHMGTKEKKICSFTQKNTRLQLIKIIEARPETLIQMGGKFYINKQEVPYEQVRKYYTQRYQVRLNRKIIDTSISEYMMRKLFATYCQNIVLQLKIY